jgi:NAD+ diphosphatase
MVGFTARYAGGDLRIDPKEIEDAGWFSLERLPQLPMKPTLSRRMLDWFLANAKAPREISPLERDPHAHDRPDDSP